MNSIHTEKEWLTKNIEDENIRFYYSEDFTDIVCIGGGAYGAVFKAKLKKLNRAVAHKILHSHNENEMIENFVNEVCELQRLLRFGYYCFT